MGTPVTEPLVEEGATLRAHDNDIRFERISLEEGLSQSVVTALLQDSRGFLWVATQDGLNRYDGYEFQVYRYDPNDPHSLTGNFINVLHEGPDGILWIGTSSGLSALSLSTGEITRFRHHPGDATTLGHDNVLALYADPEGRLWVGTGSGLDRLDVESGEFVHYRFPHDLTRGESSSASEAVGAIHPVGDGTLWIGKAGAGLATFDPETERFADFPVEPDNPEGLDHHTAHEIYVDGSGIVWVGTGGQGLYQIDPTTGDFVRYKHDPEDPRSLSYDYVQVIYEDRSGQLWVGTDAGLNCLNPATGDFIHYRHDPQDANSLGNSDVQALLEDREGVLWAGTFGNGLSRFDRRTERFHHYRHDPNKPQYSLSRPTVWSIFEDHEGSVWVGTGGGSGGAVLSRLDRETGEYVHYYHDPEEESSLGEGLPMAIVEDSSGDLWIAMLSGGLSRFDRESEEFTHYSTPGLFTLYEDREGTLWLGTAGGGLGRFDRETERAVYYEHDPRDPYSISHNGVPAIFEDGEGVLWAGTFGGGLNRFDRETERFTRFQNDPTDMRSLANNTVLAIYEDSAERFWVATTAGLNRLLRENGTFTHYSTQDGLPNDFLYGILEDERGNLWISTNMGLSRFDPGSETFTNYDVSDGLQSDEFNQGAYHKNDRGEIYFGGINGFNVFHPDEIRNNPYVPPIVLTSLTQGNQDVLLDQALESLGEVTFRWPDNFFEFEFAALSYARPERNQYAYMLEGFDETWNYVGSRRYGRYTNIPGGDYTLRVRGSNNDGVWNETGTSLAVNVVPPVWQTWWFRGAAAGVLLLGIVAIVGMRIRSVDAHKRELETLVDVRTRELQETFVELRRSKEAAEAANRAKSIFLANMTHELRTPLNAILGFAQLMGRDANLTPDQQQNLEIIDRSGEHLLKLINEVLELSKIEAGRVMLQEESVDLHRLLNSIEELFYLRARDRGLEIVFECSEEVPEHVWMDGGKLRQVLMNLLSNAVKFTEEGQVTLRVDVAAPEVLGEQSLLINFEVEDTGPGIGAEELAAVFVPFEQTQSGQQSLQGTGLGLPISQQYVHLMGGELSLVSPVPGSERGTLFRFTLPVEPADLPAVQAATSPRQVIALAPHQPLYKILVVEDNWANRRLVVQLLTSVGFDVQEAVNGQEAIEQWLSWAPRIILMDMRMPVLDGYEATRRIRALAEQGEELAIIALTASALEEDRTEVLAQGCDGFIRKPFRQEDLFDALSQHAGVRFIYQEEGEGGEEAGAEDVRRSDLQCFTGAMSCLPAELVEKLREATLQADLDLIARAIRAIQEHDAELAATLKELARNFDHDGILMLIAAAVETSGGEAE